MEICPYLEETFKIVGRSWNSLIIIIYHDALIILHFSDMKRDLKTITPRALSIKLTDLGEWGLVEKKVVSTSPVSIIYELTDKGKALAEALKPIEKWAQEHVTLEEEVKSK